MPHAAEEQGRVTVAIPAYNEEATVAAILRSTLAQPLVREAVVVDDGSSDGTWAAIQAQARGEPRIKALRHERNRGKGAALRTAFAQASSPIVIVQDADLEYDPADFPALAAPIAGGVADIVFGSRFHGDRAWRTSALWHAAGNRLVTAAFNLCARQRLTDLETGYKAFRRELLQGITLQEDRFGFDPEIAAKLARLPGARLIEVPISYRARSRAQGKKIRLRDGFTVLRCIFKYGLQA
ncbi:MAG: glycosyltransferase family 2 protein [Burkholderiales bacterium]